MCKNKVLFILHLPEPIHGAALIGKFIKESSVINKIFDADFIDLATSKNLSQIGKGEIGKVFKLFKIQLEVIKALMSKRYDLTYMTMTAKGPGFYKDIFVILILKLFRRKIIYHFHNRGVSSRQQFIFDNLLYRFVFYRTKSILLSPNLYCDIEKYVKRHNVFFCANGIPIDNDVNVPILKNENNERACRLLFLSNMIIDKGVFTLLEACKILKDKGLVFECHFVGAWHDITEEGFNQVVVKHNLAFNVFAHGKKYGEDKKYFLKNSDIFVFPTKNETFGLVNLEAMEFGLPVVSTFEGGIPDIVIDKETGFLVPTDDYIALANRIALLIQQPELRHQMGLAGKRRLLNFFTIDKFENNFSNILKDVIYNVF